MDLELSGKAFLITGGTDGVGLGLAERLLAEGALVGVCGRDEQRLESARTRLGASALVTKADVTVAAELDQLLEAFVDRFGRLDGLVNNAGRSAGTGIEHSSDDEWRDDYELKVISALHLTRRAIPLLRVSKGSVVNVLAIMARTPHALSTPTTASRAAGLALTKSLAHEEGPHGVRANAVLIGLIESGQWVRRAQVAGKPLDDFYVERAKENKVPLGRYGTPEEFADLVSFLLSPRASYITGVGIAIDGGLSPVI
jgi:NAD(P)-dependent dehydrogenase (short-subunit alcohol dehydrogenase family)